MSEGGEYNDKMVALLQLIWGEGFMTPGGPDLVRETVKGLDLEGKRVLDIGSGLGGGDIVLAGLGARVVGLDIEAPLVERARKLAAAKGLSKRVEFRLTKPGPLPFPDGSFDLVYSSGAFTQIADKESLFKEAFRVLKPGGWFAAYDWMKGPGPISDDMRNFYKMEELTYAMETPAFHRRLLRRLGFDRVEVVEDGGWYRREAHHEHDLMAGPALYPRMVALLGKDKADHFVEDWRALTVVLDKGELRPGRWRARKPERGGAAARPDNARTTEKKMVKGGTLKKKAAKGGPMPAKIGGRGAKIEKGAPANPLSGKPRTTTQNFYTDATGALFCGIWTSTKGKWPVEYKEEEFIYLIKGKVKLTAADGRSRTYKAGDAFVIPLGFAGTWETLEPIRKYYAIWDRSAGK